MNSQEIPEWNNLCHLIGYVPQRGVAWRYRASDQWVRPNYYDGAVPLVDVKERLFGWSPVSSSLYVKESNGGTLLPVPDRHAILRSDTSEVLGIFTKSYNPVHYAQWAEREIQRLLEEKAGVGIGAAALLRNGAVATILMEPEEPTYLDEGLEYRPGIFAATAFDGSLSSTFMRIVTLPAEDIMMSATLADMSIGRSPLRYKIRTTAEALDLFENCRRAYAEQFRHWLNVRVSDAQWEKILKWASTPSSSTKMAKTLAETKRNYLHDLWTDNEFVGKFSGTGFGVLLALGVYAHHGAIVRGVSRGERNFLNALTGRTFKAEQDAIETLTSIVF